MCVLEVREREMYRIHPSENKGLITTKKEKKKKDKNKNIDFHDDDEKKGVCHNGNCDIVLTVWKRSSMSFQGTDGFTVYDHRGRLAFRVDNYTRSSSIWSCVDAATGGLGGSATSRLVLMDGSGNPLLTLKPQILSMQHQWNGYIYKDDDDEANQWGSLKYIKSPVTTITNRKIFSMRRQSSSVIGRPATEAEVILTTGNKAAGKVDFIIEGSFWRRNCKIMSTMSGGEVVAKIMRKRGSRGGGAMLSDDVFSLVVKPGFDPQLIMAFVVILDRICFKPFFTSHLICT